MEPVSVTPAEAGVQMRTLVRCSLDSGLRRNDDNLTDTLPVLGFLKRHGYTADVGGDATQYRVLLTCQLRYICLGNITLEFTSNIPDASLVEWAQEGDLDAFNQLAQRYERQVYNVSLRMLGDSQLAEDATQKKPVDRQR